MNMKNKKTENEILTDINSSMIMDMLAGAPIVGAVKNIAEALIIQIDSGAFSEKLDKDEKSLVNTLSEMNKSLPKSQKVSVNFTNELRTFKAGHFIYNILKLLEQEGTIVINKETIVNNLDETKPAVSAKSKAEQIYENYKNKKK